MGGKEVSQPLIMCIRLLITEPPIAPIILPLTNLPIHQLTNFKEKMKCCMPHRYPRLKAGKI